MRRQSTITINTAAFDRAAIRLGLTRLARDPDCSIMRSSVPSNSAIARRLGVAQSTVSRARAGNPVGVAFVMAAATELEIPLGVLVRQAVAA
jgi:transcriptional regulator with XRE-family HTH domain